MEDKSTQWGLGISLIILCLLIIYFIFVYVEPMIKIDLEEGLICKAQSPEMSCYNITPETCHMAWDKYSEACKEEVKARLSPTKVTSLIGPSVKKCIQRKLDRIIRSSRKLEGGERCQSYFHDLDAP